MTDAPAPELIDLDSTTTAVIRGVVPMSELANFFDRSFPTLATVTAAQGVAITGPAYALYHGFPGETVDLEAGFPTARAVDPADGVEPGSLPAGRAGRVVHEGSYEQLSTSWERLRGWLADEGHEPGPDFWEVYVTEPSPDMDPADLRTELYWPVA